MFIIVYEVYYSVWKFCAFIRRSGEKIRRDEQCQCSPSVALTIMNNDKAVMGHVVFADPSGV